MTYVMMCLLLENDEPAGRTDEDWTVVQSRSTIKGESKASSIVNANSQGRKRSEMLVPTEAMKHVSASRSYAEVLKGKRVRDGAIADAGNHGCTCRHRSCKGSQCPG